MRVSNRGSTWTEWSRVSAFFLFFYPVREIFLCIIYPNHELGKHTQHIVNTQWGDGHTNPRLFVPVGLVSYTANGHKWSESASNRTRRFTIKDRGWAARDCTLAAAQRMRRDACSRAANKPGGSVDGLPSSAGMTDSLSPWLCSFPVWADEAFPVTHARNGRYMMQYGHKLEVGSLTADTLLI